MKALKKNLEILSRGDMDNDQRRFNCLGISYYWSFVVSINKIIITKNFKDLLLLELKF